MKVLLVQSPATSSWIPRREWEAPSIALATIAAQIDNHDVRIADMVVWRKKAKSKFFKILKKFNPEVVGFSSMTFQYPSILGFAYLAKNFNNKIITVLGGYHVSLCYEQLGSNQDRKYWDYFIRGEGDFSFGELLDCLSDNEKGIENIPGVSYKRDDKFYHNHPRPLENLEKINIPARKKRLCKGFHMYFRKEDVIETSRGCLHSCNFCSIRKMYGKSYRLFPMDRVMADIEDAYRFGARHITITDDNITLDMDRFEELCDNIIKLKLRNLQFTTQASPIGFAKRPDVAKKMTKAGFVSIFLGIENASAKSLKTMKKPNTISIIKKGVQVLQNENIIVIAGIINGLAHDDADSMRENYQFIKDLGITSIMDQIMTPYPSIPLRDEMIKKGHVENVSDYRWYDGYFSNVRTDHLQAPQLNFQRWKIRREIIGIWKPTSADWKYFKGYSYLWEFVLKHIIQMNERYLEKKYGLKGRYKLQMLNLLQLNNFNIEIPGYDNGPVYHPVFGINVDPYNETKETILKRKLDEIPTCLK